MQTRQNASRDDIIVNTNRDRYETAMNEPEYLRIPGGVVTVADDQRELRRIARSNADANEMYLRNLMGDDEYEHWDND